MPGRAGPSGAGGARERRGYGTAQRPAGHRRAVRRHRGAHLSDRWSRARPAAAVVRAAAAARRPDATRLPVLARRRPDRSPGACAWARGRIDPARPGPARAARRSPIVELRQVHPGITAHLHRVLRRDHDRADQSGNRDRRQLRRRHRRQGPRPRAGRECRSRLSARVDRPGVDQPPRHAWRPAGRAPHARSPLAGLVRRAQRPVLHRRAGPLDVAGAARATRAISASWGHGSSRCCSRCSSSGCVAPSVTTSAPILVPRAWRPNSLSSRGARPPCSPCRC